MGRHIVEFDGVHGWYNVGQMNLERKMLLEICLRKINFLPNSWLKRREKKKVTF